MKKNIAIVVCIVFSISFLVFSYTQKMEADSNRSQAIQLAIKSEELRLELVQCQENAEKQMELAKAAEQEAIKQKEAALIAAYEARKQKEIAESKK